MLFFLIEKPKQQSNYSDAFFQSNANYTLCIYLTHTSFQICVCGFPKVICSWEVLLQLRQ